MPDHSARIAQIRTLLQTGARSANLDGVNAQIDPDSLRIELRQLLAEDTSNRGRRPVVASIDLSGG